MNAAQLEQRFADLQAGVPELWRRLAGGHRVPRTAVAIPSMSLDLDGLEVPEGVTHFEERSFYLLNLLRHPPCHLVLTSSTRPGPAELAYYLQFLPGVPYPHAFRRLNWVSVGDASNRPLTRKILDRPFLLERLRRQLKGRPNAYLTCYHSSPLEMELAVRLGVPILGTDPRRQELGTKTEARKAFAEVGLETPLGVDGLTHREQLWAAIVQLRRDNPRLRTVVIKHNRGVGGLGNAVCDLDGLDSLWECESPQERLEQALGERVRIICPGLSWSRYLRRFDRIGGVVEACLEGDSVSLQLLITPDGEVNLVGTHDEITGGEDGHSYVGCRMPSRTHLLSNLHLAGLRLGGHLARKGLWGRMDIDFLALPGRLVAIDINLRKGNTNFPMRTLQLLAGGAYDPERGEYRTQTGQTRAYVSSDHLASPMLKGLLPQDLIDIATAEGLHYSSSTHTGSVFHMLGTLSRWGRVGVTCVHRDVDAAQEEYRRCLRALEEQACGWDWIGESMRRLP